ncbi:hypothetical protein BJ508DRAFT_159945 [Ascobolus immersus RN42]|uniref:Uncharacterized protein n=1 Tax=Ascobolus immersus RN42 TaxID=1160509 RepID=A0A3N4HWF1_ASCIM|nr:hypothetical protein BJ508DRAFT_159945 [Ascobolus immersus RN42]
MHLVRHSLTLTTSHATASFVQAMRCRHVDVLTLDSFSLAMYHTCTRYRNKLKTLPSLATSRIPQPAPRKPLPPSCWTGMYDNYRHLIHTHFHPINSTVVPENLSIRNPPARVPRLITLPCICAWISTVLGGDLSFLARIATRNFLFCLCKLFHLSVPITALQAL